MERSSGISRGTYPSMFLLLFVLTGWVTGSPAADGQTLRVLLTNDDGFDAPGIWSVDGSPADAVLVGLTHILKAEEPMDIVISGANFGQNLGYGSSSGTVGAATAAMYLGVPAIAVSVGVDFSERDAEPVPFPSTLGAFNGAAKLVLEVLGDLQETSTVTGNMLPAHTILNINYPAVSAEELNGVRIAQAARGESGLRLAYEDSNQSGQLQVSFRFDLPSPDGDSDTDVELFFERYATISVLDGDWDAGSALREEVHLRISEAVGQ